MGRATLKNFEFEVVREAEGFRSLQPEWECCFEASPHSKIFTTWEWLYRWWTHYGEGHRLRIVVARAEGRVAGILPLYLRETRVLRRIRASVGHFVGTGGDTSPDYLGVIADARREPDCSLALAEFAVRRLHWDGLDLSDMSPETPFERGLLAECSAMGGAARAALPAPIALVRLPGSFDAYLGTLSSVRRQGVRRKRRLVERELGGRFFVWSDAERLDQAVDELVALHHRRWASRHGPHAFSTPQYVGFHRELMRECLRRGWLRLYVLAGNEGTLAMLYCYRFRGEVSFFQSGFDPLYERLGPGSVLMGYAIEDAIREGNAVFDMLKGDHDYKTAWANATGLTTSLWASRPSLRGRAFRLMKHQLPAMKARLKEILRRRAAASAGKPDAERT
jgi:CelD/BcsL family acetyltransferase involved in cellulose biosynthesis